MKKQSSKLVIILLLTFNFSLLTAFAQIPQAINFQAIARDGSGNPMVSTNIQIRLSVIDSSQGGTIVYQELRALQTNAYGSFSFQIGVDPAFTTVGTFQSIDWATSKKHLKIDYDPSNTFSFSLTLGTIKFVSVPYAFAAQEVVYIDATGAQNGDALIYNSATGKFEPGQAGVTSVAWNDVLNKPTFSTVAASGSYNDLTNKPTLFDGTWASLTNKPTTIAGYGITNAMSTSHAANGITATSITNWNTAYGWGNHAGLYRSISWLPSWTDVTGKPTFATIATSGSYNDLTNKPTLFDGAWTSLTGKPTFATIATSGSYNDLTNKPTLNLTSVLTTGNDAATKAL